MKLKREVLLTIEVDYDDCMMSETEAESMLRQCIDQGIGKAYNWYYDIEGLYELSIIESWK